VVGVAPVRRPLSRERRAHRSLPFHSAGFALPPISGRSRPCAGAFREGPSLPRRIEDTYLIKDCLWGLAGVADAKGQSSRVIRLWGIAVALDEAVGLLRSALGSTRTQSRPSSPTAEPQPWIRPSPTASKESATPRSRPAGEQENDAAAITMSSGQVRSERRQRWRGPQVRQERGQADESNARSAPSGAAAPLPRGGDEASGGQDPARYSR
jgi:hypothetical protein